MMPGTWHAVGVYQLADATFLPQSLAQVLPRVV